MELQENLRNEYLQICELNHGVLIPTDVPFEKSYELVKDAVRKVLRNDCI